MPLNSVPQVDHTNGGATRKQENHESQEYARQTGANQFTKIDPCADRKARERDNELLARLQKFSSQSGGVSENESNY